MKKDLRKAMRRLHRLEQTFRAETGRLHQVQSDILATVAGIERERAEQASIERQINVLGAQFDSTLVDYQAKKRYLNELAGRAYMQGPLAGLDVLLGSRSFADMNDRSQFLLVLSGNAAGAAQRVADVAAVLNGERAQLSALSERQAIGERMFMADGAQLRVSLVAEKKAVAKLVETRNGIRKLVLKYRNRLTARQIEAAARSVDGAALIDNGRWAWMLLYRLRAPTCRSNMVAIVAWETAESTRAAWNPLATTQAMPGATDANRHRVKNYLSLDQGIQATILTLERPSLGFGAIVYSLNQCRPAMITAKAVNASYWCHRCAKGHYVTDLVPAVEVYYDTYASR